MIENERVARGGAEAPASSLRPPSSPSWHAVPAGCRVGSDPSCCGVAICAVGLQRPSSWQPPRRPRPLDPSRWRRADLGVKVRPGAGPGTRQANAQTGPRPIDCERALGQSACEIGPSVTGRTVTIPIAVRRASDCGWNEWSQMTGRLVLCSSLWLPTKPASSHGAGEKRLEFGCDALDMYR